MISKLLPLLLCVLNLSSGANILAVIPSPSFSHQEAFRELWKELSLRGHKITLATTNPIKDHKLVNLSEIDTSSSYEILSKYSFSEQTQEALTFWNVWSYFLDLFTIIEDHQLSLPEFQTLINHSENFKFDLVMVEALYTELIVFGKLYKCPVILMGTVGSTIELCNNFGDSAHPILNPDINSPFVGKMNFQERVISTLFYGYIKIFLFTTWVAKKQQILDRHFGKVISANVEDLSREPDMLLINESPLLTGIRAVGPATIRVGGTSHLKALNPLPQELKEYLDSAEEGFVYFSLGGNVKSKDLNNQTMSNILEALREIPYKVLWKFEANNLPGKPDNVKLIRWAPQQDVLRHPNIKVFIMQGGILSIEEAIFTHVPMVVMPFYGDQLKNARIIENKGIGKSVNHKPVLDKDEFKAAVLEVIEDEKYKKSVTELAELIQDQPMSGLETAIWWTEYVIRHKGAKHLRNPAADIPFYQYYLLDVISFLSVVLYIFVRLCIFVVKFVVKYPYKVKEKIKTT